MIMGFFGEPNRPIVEAIGMPISMWVVWMVLLERESRIAAQFAPFVMVALIPYFLKNPFSCAMTNGEQSVSAMMPMLIFGISGASDALSAVAAQLLEPSAAQRAAVPVKAAPRVRNWRRLSGEEASVGELGLFLCIWVKVDDGLVKKIFPKKAR